MVSGRGEPLVEDDGNVFADRQVDKLLGTDPAIGG